MKKALICLLLIGLIGLIFIGCAKPSPTPTSTPTQTPTEPIKIGALLQLTGSGAMIGPTEKAALEYRLDQVNWQSNGRKIQLLVEDSASDPTIGIDKARKLAEFDKIDVLLGPTDGGIAFGVANYMKQTNVPVILTMQKPIDILKLGNNILLPFGTGQWVGYCAGVYAYDKLGCRTATVILDDMTAAYQFVDGVIAGFEKKGGTIVQKQPVPLGTMDFSPNLAAMKQADAVFFWFIPEDCMRFVSQYYAAGLKMPLVLTLNSVLFPPLLAAIGEKSVGILGSGPYTSLIDTPMNKSYVDGMIKKYNLVPDAQVASMDAALTLYLEALKATGGDTTSAKIIDALKKVKVDTPAGVLSFTSERLGVGDTYIMKVVKLPDRYDWAVVDKYGQMVLDVPSSP